MLHILLIQVMEWHEYNMNTVIKQWLFQTMGTINKAYLKLLIRYVYKNTKIIE